MSALLSAPGEAERRRALLAGPRFAPLAALAAALRAEHGDAADVDPLDGGVEARLLLLLETPGPRIRDTGFVSQDNPSATAANLRRFLREARVAREDLLIWNAVPWVIHAPGARNRAPRAGEIKAGLARLPDLLALLPRLRAAVLAGHVARRARATLAQLRPGLPVFEMPHPSPTYVCTDPAIPGRIIAALSAAREAIGREPG